MKKLKILLCTGCLGHDGISNAWRQYIKAIHDNVDLSGRVHIDCIAFKENCDVELVRWYESQDCHINYLPHRQMYPLQYVISLTRLLRKEHYDILHANGQSAILTMEMLAGKLGNVAVRIAHSHNTACTNYLKHRLLWYPFQWLCTDRFACGKDAGHWLFGNRPFTVINNAKDLNVLQFSPEKRHEMRKQLNVEDKFVIGNVGRLSPEKNQSFLIDAFACLKKEHQEAYLMLIGEGPDMDACKEKVSRLGLDDSVHFVGYVTNVPDYLQAIDVIGFPSIYEGLPNVVIEWQAAGLPCVISDKVTHECGMTDLCVYEPIDIEPSQWAERLYEIRRDEAQRAKESVNAINVLTEKGYNVRQNAIRLVELYESIYEKRKNKK